MKYAITDTSGIVQTVGSFSLPTGAIIIEDASPVQAGTWMINEAGEFVERPASPVPTGSGNTVTIPPCPLGTHIQIMDTLGEAEMLNLTTDAEGWSETYTFDVPGLYQVIIQAPWPHMQTVTNFEVSDADIIA